jgi:SsrA-binding protein
MNKKEILKIEIKVKKDGYTIVPLELFLTHGFAKIELGLGKGKKLYDKRETLMKKTQNRDIERSLKR